MRSRYQCLPVNSSDVPSFTVPDRVYYLPWVGTHKLSISKGPLGRTALCPRCWGFSKLLALGFLALTQNMQRDNNVIVSWKLHFTNNKNDTITVSKWRSGVMIIYHVFTEYGNTHASQGLVVSRKLRENSLPSVGCQTITLNHSWPVNWTIREKLRWNKMQ